MRATVEENGCELLLVKGEVGWPVEDKSSRFLFVSIYNPQNSFRQVRLRHVESLMHEQRSGFKQVLLVCPLLMLLFGCRCNTVLLQNKLGTKFSPILRRRGIAREVVEFILAVRSAVAVVEEWCRDLRSSKTRAGHHKSLTTGSTTAQKDSEL